VVGELLGVRNWLSIFSSFFLYTIQALTSLAVVTEAFTVKIRHRPRLRSRLRPRSVSFRSVAIYSVPSSLPVASSGWPLVWRLAWSDRYFLQGTCASWSLPPFHPLRPGFSPIILSRWAWPFQCFVFCTHTTSTPLTKDGYTPNSLEGRN
jgi:hypothetical protein